jgi:hypothetical protein
VFINGMMGESMREIGNRIKCMEKESIVGVMGENMMESISLIKNRF